MTTKATSVRLDSGFVEEAKVYAEVSHRSVPKQIEYWSFIGKIAEENPDLPFAFIADSLKATTETNHGRITRYERRTARRARTTTS